MTRTRLIPIVFATATIAPLFAQPGALGREVSIPRHWQDDEEFKYSIPEILAYGKKLFDANWTEQEGGGRPFTKGTGLPLADPSQPLRGVRAFNRRVRMTNTDANGNFLMTGIPAGGINVTVTRRGAVIATGAGVIQGGTLGQQQILQIGLAAPQPVPDKQQ